MKLRNAGVRLETTDANEHMVQVQAKQVAFIIGLLTRGHRQINQSSVRAYSRCCFKKYLGRLNISYGLTVEFYCQYFDRQGVNDARSSYIIWFYRRAVGSRSSKVAATAVESKAIISVDNYVLCP